MTLEAPYSRHNRTSFKIYFAVCLGAAVVFAYDGYLSRYPWSHRRSFFEAHTRSVLFQTGDESGKDLDARSIPGPLRQKFAEAKASLSETSTAAVEEPGRKWVIVDAAGRYPVVKEESGLAVYREGPDETMLFNRISPAFFVAAAVVLAVRYRLRKGMKVLAQENELVVNERERIPYDAIDRIDKTYFEKKGFFTVVYKKDGREIARRLDDRDYDNLAPILDHLIAKIT